MQDDRQEAELHKEDEEEGEDLCKCEFSLAYGAKILLNNTYLHLKRGKRYGLCGPNGCGKSTLMRAISNGQVEGFPPPEELKTVRTLLSWRMLRCCNFALSHRLHHRYICSPTHVCSRVCAHLLPANYGKCMSAKQQIDERTGNVFRAQRSVFSSDVGGVQVYVEHDLDDSEVEMHVVDYLVKWFGEKDPERGVTEESVVTQLNEVGFPEELQVRPLHLFLVRNACVE